jgi:lipid II:glycine glycyltransferase (peptidoglycan interpeptide bridge formation enzyme)
LFGPDLLKWSIMQWACEQGNVSFDLGGVNPEPVDEKELNIRRFKEKWSGAYSEYLLVSA